MARNSTIPTEDDRARRDEIRAREQDRSNRRAFDALGDTNLVARHRWAGGGDIGPNADRALTAAADWAKVRDDGIAQLVALSDYDVPGLYLNRPGRWALILKVGSDAGFAGTMRAALRQTTPNDIFDGDGILHVTQPRATGYGGAGYLDQIVTWSGPVTDAEAINPITVVLRHITAGTGMAPSTWSLQANYLGTGSWPGATIAPTAPIAQDDAATQDSTTANPAPDGWLFFVDVSHMQYGAGTAPSGSTPLELSRLKALGYRGCVAKIGQGASSGYGFGQTISSMWAAIRDEARQLWPSTFAGYWYCGDTETPSSQATRCKNAIGDTAIPVALDWEEGGGSWSNLLAVRDAFVAAGLKVTMLYAGRGWANSNGAQNIDGSGLKLWAPRYYTNNPGTPRALFDEQPAGFGYEAFAGGTVRAHQFSQYSRPYDGSPYVDANSFPGTVAQLAALFNGS